jgi:effector-binding domain-containing protein
MRALLKLLFFLFVLVFALIIVGLFLPSNYKFVIKKDVPVASRIIHNQLTNLKNWPSWAPWFLNDSVAIQYSENFIGQQGSMQITDSKYGLQALTITHSVSYESVAVDFDFATPSKFTGLWYLEPIPGGSKIILTYNINGLSFFERYLSFLYSPHIKSILDESIDNLTLSSEEQKYSRVSDISLIEMLAIPTVIMIDSTQTKDVKPRKEQMENYLLRFFKRRDLTPNGKAFHLVYGEVNDTLIKFAVGFPLQERTWVWRTLEYYELPEGNTLTISHYGRSENVINAHNKLKSYLNENELELNGVPWELHLYSNDTMQKDTSLFEIQVFYPVK